MNPQDMSQVRELVSRWWSMDEEEMVETGRKMVDLQHSQNCREVKLNPL